MKLIKYTILWWREDWGSNFVVAHYPDGSMKMAAVPVEEPLTPNMLSGLHYGFAVGENLSRFTPPSYRREEWLVP